MSDNSTEHLESAEEYPALISAALARAKSAHWSNPKGAEVMSTTECVRALREAAQMVRSLRSHIFNAAFELADVDLEEEGL